MAANAKKRGRPKKLDPHLLSVVRGLWPELGRRALEEKYHMVRAVAILKDRPEYRRLLPPGGKFWFAVLTELGRIESEHLLRVVATEICEDEGMTPARALELVRYIRVLHARGELREVG